MLYCILHQLKVSAGHHSNSVEDLGYVEVLVKACAQLPWIPINTGCIIYILVPILIYRFYRLR
jgi:hypothetical protein